ncbi:MAG TPA: hypothetical protein VIH21_06230 [Dehalococcoidia bacterium]
MERRYDSADSDKHVHDDHVTHETPAGRELGREPGREPVIAEYVRTRETRVAGDAPYVESYSERRRDVSMYDSIAGRVTAVLAVLVIALEALLGARFLLLAFGANRGNNFVDFIMDVSWPFVLPFDGAFANRTWDEGIIEVNTLLAMGAWLVAGVLLSMLIAALAPRTHESGVTRSRVVHH